jgi:hypothetical protein
MYISDGQADELVANNAELQAVIHGKRVVFWIPGYGTGAGVVIGLLLGWAGPAIVANKILFPPRTAWFLLGAITAASAISFSAYRVLLGSPSARRHMNVLSTTILAFALAIFVVVMGSLPSIRWFIREGTIHYGDGLLSGIGLVAAIVAKRLVAGPFYAAFAAFFRARRAHASRLREQLHAIRLENGRDRRRT